MDETDYEILFWSAVAFAFPKIFDSETWQDCFNMFLAGLFISCVVMYIKKKLAKRRQSEAKRYFEGDVSKLSKSTGLHHSEMDYLLRMCIDFTKRMRDRVLWKEDYRENNVKEIYERCKAPSATLSDMRNCLISMSQIELLDDNWSKYIWEYYQDCFGDIDMIVGLVRRLRP